jgi:hypothetical protein
MGSGYRAGRDGTAWKMAGVWLLSFLTLLGACWLPIHIRYRHQMEAVAVVERLGGSVNYHYAARKWLQRLQPRVRFGIEPLDADWIREMLPAGPIVDYTLVVDYVSLDNGPGATILSNLSGEMQEMELVNPTDEDLLYVARFTGLERLYLRQTRISDAGLRHLRNLRQLRALYLSYTQITDQSADIIAGFENLESLRLVDTGVTDSGVAKLKALRHLQELDVRGTQVTEKGLKPFRGIPGLRLLGNGADDPEPGLRSTY